MIDEDYYENEVVKFAIKNRIYDWHHTYDEGERTLGITIDSLVNLENRLALIRGRIVQENLEIQDHYSIRNRSELEIESVVEFIREFKKACDHWIAERASYGRREYTHEEVMEFGRRAFYEGREVEKYDDRGIPVFRIRTYEEYLRILEKK